MADRSPSNSPSKGKAQPNPKPESREQPVLPPDRPSNPRRRPVGALAFWTYLTISVGLLSLLLSPLLSQRDQHSWFLSLPPDLRLHFSQGKLIKIHPSPQLPFRVFAIDSSPAEFSETVLLLPGLACNSFSFRHVLSALRSCGLRTVALDPPGSGFSEIPRVPGGLEDVFNQIRDKGIFWAFDQMVETGHAPYEEIRAKESFSPYGPAEIGHVIKEVVREMNLGPVHLVIHDSMLASGANFAASYPSLVRSVTLLDSAAGLPAFPYWALGIPVAGRLILKSPSMFFKLMRLCCSRSIDMPAVESQRLLLLRKDGSRGVVGMAKALNYSFDLREWKELDGVKEMPFQLLWSNNWSDRWIEEGRRAAFAVPEGKFSYHLGGRWSQEDNIKEITERIVEFVTSLPKTIRKVTKESSEDLGEKALEGNDHSLH
ncbi:protein AUXIN RESPONSE 4 [Carex littledalei]|uniref:Protein AUXIN RESPONSE 4 n=1 Tax=Carex littledalei TaxID=544730 RepID=A0A833VFQ6_9POAL|nr:protein AUXIN RESPONSE 4 [Carex littledalei]